MPGACNSLREERRRTATAGQRAWAPLGKTAIHATAIETDAHPHRCLVYIGLNIMRAGVVEAGSKPFVEQVKTAFLWDTILHSTNQ